MTYKIVARVCAHVRKVSDVVREDARDPMISEIAVFVVTCAHRIPSVKIANVYRAARRDSPRAEANVPTYCRPTQIAMHAALYANLARIVK